ncbi:MAG: selenide, water dikinase SelD [Sulfitobacter sp.]|nr:selenide, water dikinase SelD [Sulfitobacter sp.]
MQMPHPLTRDLVLIGGGHAHALVLRAWGMDPLPGARLTVINPGPTAPYTGMLPGHVAGHYGRDELEIDLVRLCRHAGARLILDRAIGIDRARREVLLEGRGPVAYDVASIDVGITAEMDLPGFAKHAIGAKPLDRFAARWRDFLERVETGQTVEVAVIGGGVAGVELSMAMAHALRALGAEPEVTVIEAGPDISGVGPGARKKLKKAMADLGVSLRTDAKVTHITAEAVHVEAGKPVPAALCVGAAGAIPHDWIDRTDLPLHEGFIEVGPDLGVVGDTHLFAVGDCAYMAADPRPKAGVFAVRAAPVLRDNLRAALSGGRRRRFKPQRNYLKLISLGARQAMAEKFGLTFSGAYMWRWKDRIDRAFMDRLSDLPVMEAPAVPREAALGLPELLRGAPLCGGCGAKVGGGVLQNALMGIDAAQGDVITGAGDDAAVLRQPGGGYQVISTDHLRAFVEDPAVMARISVNHALGDVWSMGAHPQVGLASIILPRMSPALQARTLAEITQEAGAALADAGAQLVGGHTTMGAELTIGLAVTGARDDPPITHAGARPGDRLILTRPIGSGVILAGDMQGKAKGREVAGLLHMMAQGQGEAARILNRAHAMTDVTGFGLAGHLSAICKASCVDATLWHEAIPLYDGARRLSQAGVASTLMPANRGDATVEGADDPLLYDPQTAGGLLAAVPDEEAERLLAALKEAGCEAAIIGQLAEGTGRLFLK